MSKDKKNILDKLAEAVDKIGDIKDKKPVTVKKEVKKAVTKKKQQKNKKKEKH